MKAIRTKYVGATNTRGSRIVATAEGVKSLSLSYPHELSGMDAHAAAAVALAQRQKWKGVLSGGGLPDGSFAFTFTEWKSDNGMPHKTERYKVNPAKRRAGKKTTRRAGLTLKQYVARPSQITRGKPGKRLLTRRKKRVAHPVKGFFPNPIQRFYVESADGKRWKRRTVFSTDKYSDAKGQALNAARIIARIEKVKVRVIRT